MKKALYVLILSLVVVSGLLYANFKSKKETAIKSTPKPPTAAESMAAKKNWEASPDGIKFKTWEASPAGIKVQASYDKIKKDIKAFADMEAVVTSVTFQRPNAESLGPKWLIVKIQDDEYMMQYIPKDFEQLSSLKVNDKIIIRSRSAGVSPNHPYLILSGDYISHNNKVLFKRDFSKDKGC